MKAVVFNEHGDIDVLKYMDVPEPQISPNEVLIKIKASGCNYNDIWARRGLPGVSIVMPHISGSDAAGEVVDIGSEVKNVKVGDEVVVFSSFSCGTCDACARGEVFFCRQFKIWGFQTGPLDGAHAEYAKVPAFNVVPKPKNLGWEQAASMPLVLFTAWRMLVTRAKVKAGDFVLIWGGAGGLGTMAVQICKLHNARAIAVANSDDKLQIASELGAAYVINRSKQDVNEEVRKITERRGVDIAFEHVGEATWETSVRSLKWGGTLVTCGATSGYDAKTDIRLLWNKQLNFLGSHMANKAEFLDAWRWVESGDIKPAVFIALPLQEAGLAQKTIEEGRVIGKVVLTR
ncbi:MAG: zinc-binding dehydrogenase [Dehalococcoidia bacterium]|jgi:NADPH:quinone reductase-like Zn-dependent oxidoreductase